MQVPKKYKTKDLSLSIPIYRSALTKSTIHEAIYSILFLLINHGVQAQQHAFDSLIPAHQFSFSTGLNLQQSMKIETFAGKQQMLPFTYLTSELIGFQYTRHIKGPFSAQIGAHIALYRFSEKIKIDKEDLTMFPDWANEDYESHDISWIRYPSYSFPIYIHANLFSRNNFLFTSGLRQPVLQQIPPATLFFR